MEKFEVPYGPDWLKGDTISVDGKADLFFLHGAGTSSRERFVSLREALLEKGIGSTAFDHIGHGETGGELLGSSLEDRTVQASVVLSGLETPPRAFFGTSMGAYTAIRLAVDTPVDALILGVPGVYAPEAYAVPFGPDFSAILRRERSWETSDAFDFLSHFNGKLLIIRAMRDEVVPSEIPERLFESALQASHREILDVDCDHQIMRHVHSDPQILEDFANKIASFLAA